MSYGCELWCQTKPIPSIETVHYKFLKYVLGVKDSTCNLSILGETGRFPMYLTHIVKLIKYCIRLEYLSKDTLVSKAYSVQKSLFTAGFNVWLSKFYASITDMDMLDDWNKISKPEKFIERFQKKLYSNYVEKWRMDLSNYPVLDSYICYKKEYECEDYLLLVRDYKLRKNISKLRLSSHSLNIEVGRHTRPKVDRKYRLCKLCNSGVIEDEEHFVMACPVYGKGILEIF